MKEMDRLKTRLASAENLLGFRAGKRALYLRKIALNICKRGLLKRNQISSKESCIFEDAFSE